MGAIRAPDTAPRCGLIPLTLLYPLPVTPAPTCASSAFAHASGSFPWAVRAFPLSPSSSQGWKRKQQMVSHGGHVPCCLAPLRTFAPCSRRGQGAYRELLAGAAALGPNGCAVAWARVGGDELAGAEVENREMSHCLPSKGNNWQFWCISNQQLQK